MSTFASDLKYGIRTLTKSPVFSLVAAGTLALGVGLNALIFSVVSGVLLRPLPYASPQDLVILEVSTIMEGWFSSSEPEFLDYQDLKSFDQVAAFDTSRWTLGGVAEPRRVQVAHVTANLMPLLGVEPHLGRAFETEEDQPGAPKVAVLSYGFWQSEYGGRDDVLGQSVLLDGSPHAILGVMPAEFSLPTPEFVAWTPLRLDRESPWARNNHYLSVWARLSPNVSRQQAKAELATFSARLAADHPDFYPDSGFRARLTPLLDAMVGHVRSSLLLLLGAVGFVLLIACVNVANLFLWRGGARRREMALRASLGASRERLVRQLVAEALLIASFGGALGLGLAWVGAALLPILAPGFLPRLHEIRVDGVVLSFCFVLIAFTTFIFGLLPALRTSKTDLTSALRIGENQSSRSSQRMRQGLVVAQMAMAVLLVLGTGVMVQSLVHLYRVDPGFESTGVVTMEVSLPRDRYAEPRQVVDYFRTTLENLRGLPGLQAVGAVDSLPLAGGGSIWSLVVDGQPVPNISDAPAALVHQVTPGYLDTLGLDLVAGRFFDSGDSADTQPVVVVNQAMADELWPGKNPIGQRMRVFAGDHPFMEIVGVVRGVRHYGLTEEVEPTWYVPHAQAFATAYRSPSTMTLVARSTVSLEAVQTSIITALREIDATVPISRIRTMEDVVDLSLVTSRFTALLLALLGGAALVLAAVGVYGVMAMAVSQRVFEIGLRMALGARQEVILRHILGEGLVLASLGVGLGLAASLGLGPLLVSFVFGVHPNNASMSVLAALLLLGTALVASFIPAWRASRVDPAKTLRG